jgi:hypothetical protein
MRKNELLTEALGMLRQAGFEPRVVRNRHWKVTWTDQYGRTRMLIVAFSPSKRRARLQSRNTLRKLLIS